MSSRQVVVSASGGGVLVLVFTVRFMSLEAVVAEAGAALGQGRSLYGPAAAGGGFSSTPGIGDAGSKVGSGAASSQQQWSGSAGSGYRDQAAGTVRALDATSEADRGTGAGVTEGGNQARQGRVGADGVVDDARRSVTALAPATGTQAGKQEMVAQLQDRVNQMRQRLLVSEQRNMLLAQQIRAAGGGYPRAGGGGGGGIPMFGGGQSGGGGFGGGSGGGSGGGFTMPNLSGLMNLGKTRPGSKTGNGAATANIMGRPAGPAVFQNLNERQMEIARTVVAEAQRRGLSPFAAKIALATGLTESGLKNLANSNVPESLNILNDGVGKDHDSTGVFQQRQSWGATRELMTPMLAAGKFYDALVKVPGWEHMSLASAAQSVQRSAFPSAYAKYEQQANQVYQAIIG